MSEAPHSSELDTETSSSRCRWFALGLFSATSFPIRQLFEALGSSPIGIAICDRNLRFVAVNSRLAEINGIPPDAHPGRPVSEFVGDLTSTVESRLERVFGTGQPLNNAELIGRLGANRDPGHWLENYFPILDDCGRVVQVGVFLISLIGLRPRSDPNLAFPGSAPPTGGHSSPLRGAVERANASKAHFSPNMGQSRWEALTARETDVLRLLASGASTKEASAILAISVKTVDTYRTRLMIKLHATSVANLVHYAIRHGILDLQA
jgi:DNA-binding CsgD family transcriptional regulator